MENPDTWALYQGIVDFTDLEQALKAWKAALPQGGEVTMALLEQSMAGQGGQAEAALALHTTLEGISRTLYGNYNGALNIYNLPTSLMAAVTAAVIPAVSGALGPPGPPGCGTNHPAPPCGSRPWWPVPWRWACMCWGNPSWP